MNLAYRERDRLEELFWNNINLLNLVLISNSKWKKGGACRVVFLIPYVTSRDITTHCGESKSHSELEGRRVSPFERDSVKGVWEGRGGNESDTKHCNVTKSRKDMNKIIAYMWMKMVMESSRICSKKIRVREMRYWLRMHRSYRHITALQRTGKYVSDPVSCEIELCTGLEFRYLNLAKITWGPVYTPVSSFFSMTRCLLVAGIMRDKRHFLINIRRVLWSRSITSDILEFALRRCLLKMSKYSTSCSD